MKYEKFILKFMELNMMLDECEDNFMIWLISNEIVELVIEFKEKDDDAICKIVRDYKENKDAELQKMAKYLKKAIYEGFYQDEIGDAKRMIAKYDA